MIDWLKLTAEERRTMVQAIPRSMDIWRVMGERFCEVQRLLSREPRAAARAGKLAAGYFCFNSPLEIAEFCKR